jgi:large subunit ribosomal protein L35
MPKLKTRKSVARRFKITRTGKVLHRAQNMRHLRRKKSKRSVRAYKVPRRITGKMAIKIKKMLGQA